MAASPSLNILFPFLNACGYGKWCMRDLPSNFFKDAAHVLLENGAAYVFLLKWVQIFVSFYPIVHTMLHKKIWCSPLSSRTASSSIWCALMFQPKVHAWYSPYAGKVLENSVVTLHGGWSIPKWTVRPLNCSPCKLWTGSRMKPSSMRTALSLLTFGRCSPPTLNEWHAWFSSRYRGDLMEIGMWTPQKLQAWGMLARGLVVFNSWCVPKRPKKCPHMRIGSSCRDGG